jgi:serine/threonine protein kinase
MPNPNHFGAGTVAAQSARPTRGRPGGTPPPLGMILGKYRIVSAVGEDGLALVYRGTQLGLDREVAIKILAPRYAADRDLVKRFRRESQCTARLSHPNIITIYDSGEQDGYNYYITESLRPNTLQDVLERERTLPAARAFKIGQDLLKAVTHIHEKDLIHRDLRPANIRFDPRENAIVTNFGQAQDADDKSFTRIPGDSGIEAYQSPEQSQGLEADSRSDLYQLALIIQEMVSGPRRPTKRRTRISQADLEAELPRGLDVFLQRALHEDPNERYQNAKDMLNALKRIDLRHRSQTFHPGRVPRHTKRGQAPVEDVADLGESTHSQPVSISNLLASQWGASAPPEVPLLNKVLSIAIPSLLICAGMVCTMWAYFRHPPPTLVEQSRDVDTNRVTVNWRTSPACFSQVEYWCAATPDQRLRTKLLPVTQVDHRHSLPDLKSNTLYNFRYLFTYKASGTGPMESSEVFDFSTPPEIQFTIVQQSAHADSAILTWESNVPTDTTIRYGCTDQYGDRRSNPDQRSETIHSMTITGLFPDTTYHYQIIASDPRGRGRPQLSVDYSFHTAPAQEARATRKAAKASGFVRTSAVIARARATVALMAQPQAPTLAPRQDELLRRSTQITDTDFRDRLKAARAWTDSLRERRHNVGSWPTNPDFVERLYFINKIKAARSLDAMLQELNRIENS